MSPHFDVIGKISKPTGNTIVESEEIDGEVVEYEVPEMEVIEGFHVNTAVAISGWEHKRVEPESPVRVYAGIEPVCYQFTDEDEYIEYRNQTAWPIISDGEVLEESV